MEKSRKHNVYDCDKTESFSEDENINYDILGEDEMEQLFRLEVTQWLQTNGKELFHKTISECIHVPSRKVVKAKKTMDEDKKKL